MDSREFLADIRDFWRLAVKRYNSRAMLASARRRAFRLDANRALPPALLILALAALFVFGGDKGCFCRSWIHSENSAKNLSLAENLSPSDAFRLFKEKRLAEDGSRYYDMYSRFPIGGTALIKLAITPFGSLSARLTAARTLALLMFCGAVVFAYLAVARLASSRWIGLAAALIAFSSYYVLYYSDEVSNESAMDIFGVMLTFHGMVVFVQDGRFRQLLIKACAALLVGWHVYGLLLAFIVFGLAREIVARARRRGSSGVPPARGRKFDISTLSALVRSRYMILGAATLLFGIVVLGSGLVNEYYAHGGDVSPRHLPSVASALRRTGTLGAEQLDWTRFAALQLFRAGGAALPYAFSWKHGHHTSPHYPPLPVVSVGILAVVGALAGAALARRHWTLWATLALFGFFWSLLARGNAGGLTVFEATFYVGVPLALFGLALMGARRIWGERAPVAAALAAVAVFAVSAFQIQTGELPEDFDRQTMKAEIADFEAIREKTRGEVVKFALDDYMRVNFRASYYLSGSVFADGGPLSPSVGGVKYVVSRGDYEGGKPLTPENRGAFLYEVEPFHLHRAELRRVESAEPAARSDFDVYLEDDTLTYIKAPCAESDTRGRFFLSVRPVNSGALREDRRAIGHDSLNFSFAPDGIIVDGKCAIRRELPPYPIAAISTGRWIPGEGETWSAEINIPPNAKTAARYEAVYESAKSSGEPINRSDFDVYLDAHALTYLKEPCAESDTRGEFFLDVRPVKPEDLAEDRRESGFDDASFGFDRYGAIFNGKCMARREIPGYAIAEISTGRRVPDAGEIWRAAINFRLGAESAAYYEAIYQAAKSSGDPLIESDFDVYKEGGALTYLKAPCAEYDTRGRFLLSVHPVDLADLPEDRRELGHASLNFDFAPDGIIFSGKCMARRELPDYPISKIETGQWIPGGERLWTGAADLGD